MSVLNRSTENNLLLMNDCGSSGEFSCGHRQCGRLQLRWAWRMGTSCIDLHPSWGWGSKNERLNDISLEVLRSHRTTAGLHGRRRWADVPHVQPVPAPWSHGRTDRWKLPSCGAVISGSGSDPFNSLFRIFCKKWNVMRFPQLCLCLLK